MNNNKEPENRGSINPSQIYQFQSGMKSIIGKVAGYLIGIFGMLGAFFVSLLSSPEGTISVKDKLYDGWFWLIWGVIFVIAITVWFTNYRVSKAEAKKDEEFLGTLDYYKEKKDQAMPYMDVVNGFCVHKNKEIFDTIEREIVESADLNYVRYKNGEYKLDELEKYQKKRLKRIRKIKIKKLRGRDLTQEIHTRKNNTFSFLPKSEEQIERQQLLSTMVSRAISTFSFMIIAGLSFSMLGWVSAIVNAFGIFSTWIGSIVTAYDVVLGTLRVRYIARADLLDEFYNTRENYMEKLEQEDIIEENENDNNNNEG